MFLLHATSRSTQLEKKCTSVTNLWAKDELHASAKPNSEETGKMEPDFAQCVEIGWSLLLKRPMQEIVQPQRC